MKEMTCIRFNSNACKELQYNCFLEFNWVYSYTVDLCRAIKIIHSYFFFIFHYKWTLIMLRVRQKCAIQWSVIWGQNKCAPNTNRISKTKNQTPVSIDRQWVSETGLKIYYIKLFKTYGETNVKFKLNIWHKN